MKRFINLLEEGGLSMRVFNKKVLAFGVVCMFVLLSSVFLFAGDIKAEKMVCTYATLANDFFLTFDQGAKEAVEALGNEYMGMTDDRRPEKFISNISSSCAAGVKMVFGYSTSIEAVVEATRLVNREKVHYATVLEIADWWTPLDAGPYWGGFKLPDPRTIGLQGGEVMAEALGGEGNTRLLLGFPGSKAGNDRGLGYRQTLKKYPNMKILDEQYGDFVRDKGYKLTADWIIKYGKKIDGIYCTNTSMAVGAAVACKEAGLTKVIVIGTDANKENMKYLKDGSVHAICGIYGPWLSGHAAVAVYDLRNGWKPTVPETLMSTGFNLLTKDTAQWYIDTFCQEKMPYDWKKMSRTLHPNDWDPQNLMVPIYPERFSNWEFVKKPKGYKVPKEYKEAMDAGEYDKIRELYRAHFKDTTPIPPSSGAPYDKIFCSNNTKPKAVVDTIGGNK